MQTGVVVNVLYGRLSAAKPLPLHLGFILDPFALIDRYVRQLALTLVIITYLSQGLPIAQLSISWLTRLRLAENPTPAATSIFFYSL